VYLVLTYVYHDERFRKRKGYHHLYVCSTCPPMSTSRESVRTTGQLVVGRILMACVKTRYKHSPKQVKYHPRWLVPCPTFEIGCQSGTLNTLLPMHSVRSCWYPIERLPWWRIGEGSPDMVGTGEIKYPRWTKTSTTALWRRGTFKG